MYTWLAMSEESRLSGTTSRMVGQVGIEPTANWLRANCSTTELLTRKHVTKFLALGKEIG